MGEALTVKLKNCATDRVGRQYPSRAMFAMMFAPWVEDYHQGIKDETDEALGAGAAREGPGVAVHAAGVPMLARCAIQLPFVPKPELATVDWHLRRCARALDRAETRPHHPARPGL